MYAIRSYYAYTNLADGQYSFSVTATLGSVEDPTPATDSRASTRGTPAADIVDKVLAKRAIADLFNIIPVITSYSIHYTKLYDRPRRHAGHSCLVPDQRSSGT